MTTRDVSGGQVSKAIALEFVAKLLSEGYTAEHAERESCAGFDPCDGSDRSYIIRQGTISVPVFGGQSFRFRKLASELQGRPIPKSKTKRAPSRFEQLELI